MPLDDLDPVLDDAPRDLGRRTWGDQGSVVTPSGFGHARAPAGDSIRTEALFLPRVGVVVVAVALPEAQPVRGRELERANPLRALPEVPLRHDQPQRVAVVGL